MKCLKLALALLICLSAIAAKAAPPIVNVVDYGAKCDGVTDDTAAIRNAITVAGMTARNGDPKKIVLIPGVCIVTDTITVRSPDGGGGFATIECTGGTAGLWWKGADNHGPLLVLGDITAQSEDYGFLINNCALGGVNEKYRPSSAVRISMVQNAVIQNSIFFAVMKGIDSTRDCLFCTFVLNMFKSCDDDCIYMEVNNGTVTRSNNFYRCAKWCYHGDADAVTTHDSDYYEGNVRGALGSIYLREAHGARIINNTFEDGAANNPNFRSLKIDASNATTVNDNYWVGGDSPDYWVELGTGGSGRVNIEFRGNRPYQGASGHFIKNEDSGGQKSCWGGQDCEPSWIWGGTYASQPLTIAPCGRATGLK